MPATVCAVPAAATMRAVRPTVLIVDDHDEFRTSARALLEAEGFAVVGEAADGAEAIEAVAALRPAVVVLDIQLPGRNGLAVAEVIAAGPDPPAVVLVSSRERRVIRPTPRPEPGARVHRQERALGRGARRPARLRAHMRRFGLLVWPAAVGLGWRPRRPPSRGTSRGTGCPISSSGLTFIACGTLAWERRGARRRRRALRRHGRHLVPRELLVRPPLPPSRATGSPHPGLPRLAPALTARPRGGRGRLRRPQS